MAALIEAETGIAPELVVGGRGEFTVWVGGEAVAKKDAGGFPEDQEAMTAVRRALAPKGGPSPPDDVTHVPSGCDAGSHQCSVDKPKART